MNRIFCRPTTPEERFNVSDRYLAWREGEAAGTMAATPAEAVGKLGATPPSKDDRTTDEFVEAVAPQFVKDIDTHIEMMSGLRGEEAYALRRLITISFRDWCRGKGIR